MACLFRIHSLSEIFISLTLKVKLQFVIEILIGGSFLNQRAPAKRKFIEQPHLRIFSAVRGTLGIVG